MGHKLLPCLFYGKSLPLLFDLTGNILELNPFSASRILAFLIDALKVMPSSINASNGPLIGAALLETFEKHLSTSHELNYSIHAESVKCWDGYTRSLFGAIGTRFSRENKIQTTVRKGETWA